MRLMCDIVALAFQTDKTRVATLLLCRDLSGLFYPFLDVRLTHHPASHDDRSDAYERITRYFVSQLSYLCDKLAAMPEGESTVLDHSCLMFLSNMWSGFKRRKRRSPTSSRSRGRKCKTRCSSPWDGEMGAYAEAFARDRWRIYKCEERLRVINLGGTAVGTGLGAPRPFIFQATDALRALTGLGLARADNLVEATQNTDVFVEVSGMLKALASSLLKVSFDLRLLSSGPHSGLAEIRLPARQSGSSIMPGKVNPVVPEAVGQVAMRVMAADSAITMACSLGSLELNPFLPLIADELLGSLNLLRNACHAFARRCVRGIESNREACTRHVAGATATATALVGRLGYSQVEALIVHATSAGTTLREGAEALGLLSATEFDALVSPEAVNRLGSTGRAREDGHR